MLKISTSKSWETWDDWLNWQKTFRLPFQDWSSHLFASSTPRNINHRLWFLRQQDKGFPLPSTNLHLFHLLVRKIAFWWSLSNEFIWQEKARNHLPDSGLWYNACFAHPYMQQYKWQWIQTQGKYSWLPMFVLIPFHVVQRVDVLSDVMHQDLVSISSPIMVLSKWKIFFLLPLCLTSMAPSCSWQMIVKTIWISEGHEIRLGERDLAN